MINDYERDKGDSKVNSKRSTRTNLKNKKRNERNIINHAYAYSLVVTKSEYTTMCLSYHLKFYHTHRDRFIAFLNTYLKNHLSE